MFIRALASVAFAAGSILVWFLYLMGHPRPGEPRFIYRLRRHPSAIPEYIALLAYGLFQPRLLRTGASKDESALPLPGDDLVPEPRWQETRAITVDVPPEHLWPWIVQMGAGRGGWYWWTPGEAFPEYAPYITHTYDILPEFQTLKVGDRLSDGGPSATEERGNWVVKSIEPCAHLVLYAARQVSGGADYDPTVQNPSGLWFVSAWSFVLRPIGEYKTRWLVRVRATGGPAWLFPFIRLVLGKGDTVAHRSMFERVKARAEAAYNRSSSGVPAGSEPAILMR